MLIERMARDLELDVNYIRKVARRSEKYYRFYFVPKKSGGNREIFHPSPILKTFQYWLNNRVFRHYPVHICSTAYGKGCSIKTNARRHLGSNYLLHMDIKDFFPSINGTMLENLLQQKCNTEIKLDLDDIKTIKGLCLRHNRLTIGSVCAPVVCNAVMYNFDKTVCDLSKDKQLIYTRYADDLVFSGHNHIPSDWVEKIASILKDMGFELNRNKTYFMSGAGRQIVTGIVINKGQLSIGRQRKEYIKRLLYRKLKFGEGKQEVILGYLHFLRDIEPDYFNQLVLKYGLKFDLNIMAFLSQGESDLRRDAACSLDNGSGAKSEGSGL